MRRFEINSRAKRAGRILGLFSGRAPIGPQVVSLEVTHHCNLHCSFCESHGSLQIAPITARRDYAGGRRQMDLETIRTLAADLARLGVDLVELSGKGDPIAHRQLSEIIRIIKAAGLRCALVTNGTLAQPDLAETLVERGLDRLSVSLNAGRREVYRASNGRDLMGKAIAFLEEVLEHRKNMNTDRPWVRISHVVTKENVADMEAMVAVPCDLGVDEVVWYVVGELPETSHLRLDADDIADILERIPEWNRRFEAAGVVHDLEPFGRELGSRVREEKVQDNPLQRFLPCYEGWMFSVIGPDGVVVPCCYCEEERLGNVNDASFRAIWHGVAYRALRQRMRSMPRTGRPVCPECFTNCNRATQNQRLYNRIHPLKKVDRPGTSAEPAPTGSES